MQRLVFGILWCLHPRQLEWCLVVLSNYLCVCVCVFTSGFRFSVHDKTSHVWVTAPIPWCFHVLFANRLRVALSGVKDALGKKSRKAKMQKGRRQGKTLMQFCNPTVGSGLPRFRSGCQGRQKRRTTPRDWTQHSQLLGSRKTGKQVATEATTEDQKSSKEGKKKQRRSVHPRKRQEQHAPLESGKKLNHPKNKHIQ